MNPYPVGAVVGGDNDKSGNGQIVSHGTTLNPNCTCPKMVSEREREEGGQ